AGAATAPGATLAPTPAPTATPAGAPPGPPPPLTPPGKRLRLWAYPELYLYDGRGANRRWLQELPEPVIRGAWSSWAEIHSDTAKRMGVDPDDIIEITRGGSRIQVPVYIWDGVQRDTVAVPIGEGHTAYGRYASGCGVNVWPVLGPGSPEITVKATGDRKRVTRWKGDALQHKRDIVQTMPLGGSPGEREVTMPVPEGYGKLDFYPGHEHHLNRWAMAIDVDRCIGCNACAAACYAENSLATVGEMGIYRAREMAWMRVDRYIDWSERSAPIHFLPMLCQHCDAAPCEPVCPVYAAVHSEDGLNEQIYNRCIGTRYCSNNCPWKVRRFNWFDYEWPEPLNYQLNPDVSVRSRGVMEKCTFCVQRIRQARIVAKREGRPIRDGEITPACVQTCPTGVFTFGDLLDRNSRVARMIHGDPRAYQVLHELNTKTAVIYLKRIVERA
ncbi:MAG TPA: 4Fe-4S dicluster domain-containing protein, partial [Chloroflexota bacterium]|nr:4Fe-4S dicluster domain-containing protein [Chloroflexota bacterium]